MSTNRPLEYKNHNSASSATRSNNSSNVTSESKNNEPSLSEIERIANSSFYFSLTPLDYPFVLKNGTECEFRVENTPGALSIFHFPDIEKFNEFETFYKEALNNDTIKNALDAKKMQAPINKILEEALNRNKIQEALTDKTVQEALAKKGIQQATLPRPQMHIVETNEMDPTTGVRTQSMTFHTTINPDYKFLLFNQSLRNIVGLIDGPFQLGTTRRL